MMMRVLPGANKYPLPPNHTLATHTATSSTVTTNPPHLMVFLIRARIVTRPVYHPFSLFLPKETELKHGGPRRTTEGSKMKQELGPGAGTDHGV